MNALHARLLLPVVFLTGGSVLLVEVLATRILAPYFGNTIFTVSSVIGIVLAALSLGYAVGGRQADRAPSFPRFYGTVAASGFSLLALSALATALLPLLGARLSLVAGPPAASVLLFFLPSFLLGTLSPLAIALHVRHLPERGAGGAAGRVFAWSTVGSIVGSFAAGFVFIPRFGVTQVMVATGLFLLSLGGAGVVLARRERRTATVLACLGLVGAGAFFALLSFPTSRAVFARDGVYEKITIVDEQHQGRPTRFLLQDRSSSGAQFLDGDDLVYDYTKYSALHRLLGRAADNILVLGGGAYSIPVAFLRDLPDAHVDVVEIEPSLFDVARTYFRVPDDPRLRNIIADGRRFLRDTDRRYDIIFTDVYQSLYSIPLHFTTREFFTLTRDRLAPGGLFIANVIGDLSRQAPSLVFSEIRTMQDVFPEVAVFAVRSPHATGPQNLILVGTMSPGGLDPLSVSLDTHPSLRDLALLEKVVDLRRFELSAAPVLTDNYAPIEYFTSFVMRRAARSGSAPAVDGQEALALVAQQLRYGPRHLAAEGHGRAQEFLAVELSALGAEVRVQSWQHRSASGEVSDLRNIIGRFFHEKSRRVILATHYDTRRYADKDPNNSGAPVPGANDGASGVAVLLEVARVLANAEKPPDAGVDIVFFDGEEGEAGVAAADWQPLGSRRFTENLREFYPKEKPTLGVVLDMVCDRDLKIPKEPGSVRHAPEAVGSFWRLARERWPETFPDEAGPEIRDDHTTLNKAGIPSFLLIDSDYPAFHTTRDTLSRCSAESLERVGSSVLQYLYTFS